MDDYDVSDVQQPDAKGGKREDHMSNTFCALATHIS